MVFKLCGSAQKLWRRLNVPERLADVLTGINIKDEIREKKETD